MERETIPWWATVVSVLGALLLVAGAVIAAVHPSMLAGPNEPVTWGLRVMAGYVVARNGALGLLLLAALWMRQRAALQTLLLLYGAVQLLDAGMDAVEGRWAIVPVALVLAAVLLLVGRRLGVRAA